MSKKSLPSSLPVFEAIKQIDEFGEYWSARELADALQYSSYDKFRNVGRKAFEACKNSGQNPKDHFSRLVKMVSIGSGAKKEVEDVRLSRYACYLIVQNADPSKEIIALGQTYFAVQTRIQEIQQMADYEKLNTEEEKRLFLREEMKKHNKHLSIAAKGAGVIDPLDYAIFKNFGYKGLYDGLDRRGIQRKKGLGEKDEILDHMGSSELASNLFVATQTEEKLKKENVKDKTTANRTHFNVGKKVRQTIKEIGGTMPEDLPAAENIKQVEAKTKKRLPQK
ncbi:MAG TPA: DNA damage-inducible protein D [Puia sp.]|nr:DNA damage-inducible protein D [Puia sp.]